MLSVVRTWSRARSALRFSTTVQQARFLTYNHNLNVIQTTKLSDTDAHAWVSSFENGFRKGLVILNPEVFNGPVRPDIMHRHVVWSRANKRQGTVKTKVRSEVRGGGKKPWRQKGTGRARVSSIRSPLHRGGGVTHGPRPRDWSMKLQKKVRQYAIRTALAAKFQQGDLEIVDDFLIPRTGSLGLQDLCQMHGWRKALFVSGIDEDVENLSLAIDGLQKFALRNQASMSVHDMLKYTTVVLSTKAVSELEQRLRFRSTESSKWIFDSLDENDDVDDKQTELDINDTSPV